MAKNNAINLDITENADGFDIAGGTTERKLSLTGADITLTGSGSNTYTYPSTTDTLVGRDSTDTLTNKTINTSSNTITVNASDVSDFDTEVSNNSSVSANTSKATNVSTNLSAGPRTATTMDVDSSDGTDATLVEADTTNAGILGSDKWDEIVANSLKVSNANHTGDVTGSTSLTIGVDKVKDTMIDFGTGAGQVSTADLPEQTNLYYTESRVNANSDVSSNTTHRGLTNNPHSVDKTDVGLSNVTNVATSDTAYNSTSWNTNTDSATKNAIRDKIEVMDTAIGLNTSKVTNVTTNLSAGTRTATTIAVNSSDGTNATLVEADTTNAGILGSDKWDEIVANTLKDTNVSTNLSEGTSTETTVDVDSSDGTNATLVSASTSRAGLLTKAKFDEIVVNNAKTSFSKTNVKGTINHGATAGTTRPSGFDSVEWQGTVTPDNAINGDTFIDTT